MRYGSLMMAGLLPLVANAAEEPRISEILPVAGVPWMDATIADAEGNGTQDIIFLNNQFSDGYDFSPPRVWIKNKGQRKFSNPLVSSYRHGAFYSGDQSQNPAEYAETLTDVDADGRMDIFAVKSYWSSEISGTIKTPVAIFLGENGEVLRRQDLAEAGTSEWSVVTLGDGLQKVWLEARPNSTGCLIKIWKWSPQGGLIPWNSQTYQLDKQDKNLDISAAVARDMDGDGDEDLFLGSWEYDTESAHFLERNSDTSFAEEPRNARFAPHCRWADLNGDGLPDPYWWTGEFVWCLNKGNFQFSETKSHTFSTSETRRKLQEVSSIEGGAARITLSEESWNPPTNVVGIQEFRFGTWETLGDATIKQPADLPRPTSDWSVVGFHDMDNDGHNDVLIRATTSFDIFEPFQTDRPARIGVAWGTPSGFTGFGWITDPPFRTSFPKTGDFDRDGDVDLVLGPDVDGITFLLTNDGSGNFRKSRKLGELLPAWLLAEGASADVMDTEDLNGDGKLDLLVRYRRENGETENPDTGVASAFGMGNGIFAIPGLQQVALAKKRSDLKFFFNSFVRNLRDVFSGAKTWSQISWPPVPDATELRNRSIFRNVLGEGPSHVMQFIDMDGDRDLDVVEFEGWRENIRGEFPGGFRPMLGGITIRDLMGNPLRLAGSAVGDLDGDRKPDFVSLHYGGDDGAYILPPSTFMGIGWGNGRGGMDSISKLEINLVARDLLGNVISGSALIADIDGDGLNDFVTHSPEGPADLIYPSFVSRWYRNPGSGSRDIATWPVAILPISLADGFKRIDFDGNGSMEWSGARAFFKSNGGIPEVSQPYDFPGPVSISNQRPPIAIADFDGDGDADLLYVNDAYYYYYYGSSPHLSLVRNTIIDERIPKLVPQFKWPVKSRYRR